MTNKKLQLYYNNLYTHEDSLADSDFIEIVKTPTSRFEAVVKYFPKYFMGGDILELGAGNGYIAKSLLHHNQIKTYTLGDISLPRVINLKKKPK